MLERLLDSSVRHRRTIVIVALAASIAGAFALRLLPIDAVPDITNNQVQVNTLAPALSPFEVERQVTFPIETALSGVPGLEYTRSLSRNGFSQVTAVFADAVDIYFARAQVNERLGEAREHLAPGAEPRMGPISTGLGEIYMWTVEFAAPAAHANAPSGDSPGLQPDGSYRTPEGEQLSTDVERAAWLRTVQDWIIRPQLKAVPGVAGVDSIGGWVKQYHVEPDPMKLVAYGLTFADLIDALERNNVSTGAGYVEHKGEAYLVRAAGRIATLPEIESIVVGTRRGTPIHVHDVAQVAIGKELRTGSASENGKEVVVGTALMLIGSNSRRVAAAVGEKMAEIERSLPPGVAVKTVLDRTKLVNATIRTVATNLAEGAALVILVLFLLLGNFRAAIITALAIPLSMLLTAIGMVRLEVSGNLMSLGAIDFGLIVDGAVIVVENCLRRLAERQRSQGRALNLDERLREVTAAAKEVIGPSVYGQCIIVIVYVPILALTGIEGKMFHPMAITVICALAAAFVLSLTVVPALVALLIRGRVKEVENPIIRGAKRLYLPMVRAALRRRVAVISGAILAFAGAVFLFFGLGQEFVPTLDEKDIAMHAVRIPSTSLSQSTRMQLEIERTLSRFPEVAFVFSKTGTAELASDPMPPNVSDTFIILKPPAERPNPDEPKRALLARIEAELRALPGNHYEFTQPIQMRFNELIAGVRSDVAVKVYGDDFARLRDSAEAIASRLETVRGAADVKVEQTEGLPVMTVEIDRRAISRYGLDVADVQAVVSAAVGGQSAGVVYEGDRRFEIVVRLSDEIRRDVLALENLPVPLPGSDQEPEAQLPDFGSTGRPSSVGFVPLGSVARVVVAEGPNQISRENGKRRVVVQANVRGRDLGSFVADAEERIQEVPIPAGGWLEWGGQFQNLVAARARLALVVPLCFALIFVLLFGSFGSVRYALLVFSGVPLGLTGGVLALWLRDMPFSISAAVGFIALSGVAVLNGLVMVTFINQLRARGESLADAVVHGSTVRLRPVLMTALVASLGFVPMALATSTGAEVQKPLATVVIGGIISSTFLTLVVLPALYVVFSGEKPRGPEPEISAEIP